MSTLNIEQSYKASISLANVGLPIGTPPSGTIGNNGALSALATALNKTYSDGIYLYFIAGAIHAGSAAGHYYCVMSSTTAGTIYNNTYTSGKPAIPASPTAFVTTGPGAYTQSTAEITSLLLTDIVPAGLMGINGTLKTRFSMAAPSTAGTKTIKFKLGASSYHDISYTTLAFVSPPDVVVVNKGRVDRQISSNWQISAAASDPSLHLSEDTATAKSISVTFQLGVATDYSILNMFMVEVSPS